MNETLESLLPSPLQVSGETYDPGPGAIPSSRPSPPGREVRVRVVLFGWREALLYLYGPLFLFLFLRRLGVL